MALKAMRFSDTECIQQFLEKYDSIPPRDQKKLPFEAIAISVKINLPHLLGEIMLAMREYSVNSVKFIAVANHPEMIKKQVEFAMTPGGSRDREALNIMLGASPSPKGPTFINKFFNIGHDKEDMQTEQKEELVSDEDFVFPDASVLQQSAHNKFLKGK